MHSNMLAAEIEAKPRSNRSRGSKGLSILVAEDNEINALLARALLTRLGHRPTIAANGEAARGILAGGARCRQPLRSRADGRADAGNGWPGGRPPHPRRRSASRDKPTRMLALTANAQTEDREAALAAGMDGLLVKPLDRERLREVLEAGSGSGANPLAA